jgi:hypothetical protein
MVTGFAVGAFCAWTMFAVRRIFVQKVVTTTDFHKRSTRTVSASEWYFRALYFSMALWIMFALFLGVWLSSLALRLVF